MTARATQRNPVLGEKKKKNLMASLGYKMRPCLKNKT
jgi:hypothetical protein